MSLSSSSGEEDHRHDPKISIVDVSKNFWIPEEVTEQPQGPLIEENKASSKFTDLWHRKIFVPYLISNFTILLYDKMKEEKISIFDILKKVVVQNQGSESKSMPRLYFKAEYNPETKRQDSIRPASNLQFRFSTRKMESESQPKSEKAKQI